MGLPNGSQHSFDVNPDTIRGAGSSAGFSLVTAKARARNGKSYPCVIALLSSATALRADNAVTDTDPASPPNAVMRLASTDRRLCHGWRLAKIAHPDAAITGTRAPVPAVRAPHPAVPLPLNARQRSQVTFS